MDKRKIRRRGLLRAIGLAASPGIGATSVGAVSTKDRTDSGNNKYGLEQELPVKVRDFEDRVSVHDSSEFDPETLPIPERDVGIRPGSWLFFNNLGCTGNYIFRPADPGPNAPAEARRMYEQEQDALYIGTAGHCMLDDAPASQRAASEDEEAESLSDMTVAADIDGTYGASTGQFLPAEAVELGEVIYARQRRDTRFADFALTRIPSEVRKYVNPSLPQFEGPTGTVRPKPRVTDGRPIHGYGSGQVIGEVYPTKGRTGTLVGDSGYYWAGQIPANFGDSGAPVVLGPGETIDREAPPNGAALGIMISAIPFVLTRGAKVSFCKEIVYEDIGLPIEVVTPDEW